MARESVPNMAKNMQIPIPKQVLRTFCSAITSTNTNKTKARNLAEPHAVVKFPFGRCRVDR